jgi:hypothetical protein
MTTRLTAALTAGLMFFIISHPFVYQAVDSLVGRLLGNIASPSGCPTTWGLVVHSLVFAGATYYSVGL